MRKATKVQAVAGTVLVQRGLVMTPHLGSSSRLQGLPDVNHLSGISVATVQRKQGLPRGPGLVWGLLSWLTGPTVHHFLQPSVAYFLIFRPQN